MSKTLYVKIDFVQLNQKKPSDYGSAFGLGPKLDIGGITTNTYKYDIVQGFGDPGENQTRPKQR